MPWARLHDQANGNAKLLAIGDSAHRLWSAGLIYCQANLTDGFIPEHAIPSFGVRARGPALRRAIDELCASLVPGKGPLWHRVPGGYQVHDYLHWNDSKEAVLQARAATQKRVALFRDTDLREQIRARDGNQCRYCGHAVHWADRKGPNGGTYDHVDPKGPNTLDNLVVSCRGCNSRKGSRTPDAAGMRLQPVLFQTQNKSSHGSRSDQGLRPELVPATTTTTTEENQKEQRRLRGTLRPPDENPRLLTKLAHVVLDDVEAGHLDPSDVSEELKTRAAKARLLYDSERIRKALDSARATRKTA